MLAWIVQLGYKGGTSAVVPTPAPATPAPTGGRVRHKRKKLFVEIDGQYFEAFSVDHAKDILATARVLAEKAAQSKADDLVTRASPKVIKAGTVRPIAFKAPVVVAPKELSNEAERTREAIRRAYEQESIRAELQLLLALQAAREAEDEEDVLLLLH